MKVRQQGRRVKDTNQVWGSLKSEGLQRKCYLKSLITHSSFMRVSGSSKICSVSLHSLCFMCVSCFFPFYLLFILLWLYLFHTFHIYCMFLSCYYEIHLVFSFFPIYLIFISVPSFYSYFPPDFVIFSGPALVCLSCFSSLTLIQCFNSEQ